MAKVLGNVSGGAKVIGNVKADPGGVAATVGRTVRGAAALQPSAAAVQAAQGAAGTINPSADLMAALAQSTADLGGNVLQSFDTLGRGSLAREIGTMAGVPEAELPPVAPANSTWLGQAGKYLEDLAAGVPYQPRAPFESIGPAFDEGILSGAGQLGRFLLEQGVTSVPHTLGAVAAPVPYALGMAQDIAETRAENNQSGDVTVDDFLAAVPFAAASAFLDRFGGLGIFKGVGGKTPVGRILGSGWREAWTEFLQEQAQYAGETIGTARPWDIGQSLMRGAAGALGGAGMGAAGRGAVELIEAVAPGTKPSAAPLPIPVQGGAAGKPPPQPGGAGAPRQPQPPAPEAADLKIGETVGLKTPNARGGFRVINATPEKVEGNVVFWRDEDGVVNTDLVEDFLRDRVAAVAPKKAAAPTPPPEFTEAAPPPVTLDPLASAEPERTPPPRPLREAPLLVEAPAAPRPRRQPPAPDIPVLRRAVQTWDENIYRAEDAFARGLPGAKSSDEIEAMRRAREEAAGRLAAAMAARSGQVEAAGAEADQALTRVNAAAQAQNLANQEAQGAEAEAAMRRVQALPRPAPQQSATDLAGAAKQARRRYQRLTDWILSRGGMRDPGGELRAMDLQRRPGFIRRPKQASGTLISGQRTAIDAWDPDYVREAAIEAGYLPEGASTADLFDAIAADLRGEGPVQSSDVGEFLDAEDAARAAAAADRYENMYGTDEALANLRFNADRLGLGWDSADTATDIQAAIDERLALMDAASVDAAERLLADAERAADEALAAEWDSQADMEEDTDGEPEPAFEDRAAEAEDGQAGQEAAEGRAAPAPEPEAEGDAGDERAAGPDREEATAGDGRPVLESVVGPRDGGATPRRPFIRPVTARGRDAINRRVQAERWKNRRENERRRAEGRSDAVPEISADEEAEVQAFTQFLGDHLLKGIGLGIVAEAPGERVLGNFDPQQNIVTMFRNAVEAGMFSRTMMHELWHAMEGNLAPRARQAVIDAWRRAAEKYMLRQEWMQAFAERNPDGTLLWVSSSLPPADTAAFMATQWGQRAVATGVVELKTGSDKQARAYVNWTRDNYRFHNASEFFAEAMSDRFQAMRGDMDAFTGSVFDFMRAIWNRIVAGLRRLFGPDVMGDIFNSFRDGAITVPQRPLAPIFEEVMYGGMVMLNDPDAGPDRPLGSQELQNLQVSAATQPTPQQPLFHMGKLMAMFKQASWLARKEPKFAPYYQALLDEHYLETRLIRDGGDAMERLLRLKPEQQATANAIFEVARLAGLQIQNTGRRLVIQVPQVGPGGVNIEPELAAVGDVLTADMETTRAILDTVNFLEERWFQMWGSIAAANGYAGEFTAPGIAQAKADAQAKGDRAAERLADFAQELYDTAEQNRREGYIPFMRYGDTAVIVKDKNAQPGANPVVYMTLVDTNQGMRNLVSGYGESKQVRKVRQELAGRYPSGAFDIEVRRIGEQELEALDLPMMDKLMIAAHLDKPAAAVKVYQSMISLGSTGEKKMFKDIAAAMQPAARRQIIEQIKSGMLRRSRNVPGYETNFIGRSLLDYNRASSGVIAKRMMRTRVEDARRGVFGHRETKREAAHPTVVKWVEKWEKYIEGPEDSIWRTGRFLGFYMNMFGSFSSAMVNTMSTATVTIPQMMTWSNTAPADVIAATRFGIRGIRFAMKRGLYINPKALGLKGALLDAVIKADKEGVLSPSLAADLYGKAEARYEIGRKGTGALQAYLEVGASLFNYAEQANRYIAYIAAWKAAQKPANRQRFARMYAKNARVQEMIKTGGLTPETIATFMVENTQFIGGQIDRSPITRYGGGIVLQFKQYALNYIRVLRENFRDQGMRGKVVGLTMLGTMMFLGGVLALPGVEDIMALVQTLYSVFNEGETWNIETDLREFFADLLGSELSAELVAKGFSREFTGMDLSSRIGIGRLTPEFGDPLLSIPLLAATVGRMQEAITRFNRGEEAGGTVALLSPVVGKGVADLLRGFWVLGSEGYVTRTGTQKFAPHEITLAEQIMQAAGLRPAKFARTLEYDYAQRRIATQMNGPRAMLMDQLANAGYNAMKARENGDEEAALRFEEEMLAAYDAAWEAYSDPSTPPERLVKPPEWRDVMRAIQDRDSELSRLKRAPKLAREAMQDVPYVRE